MAGNKTIKKNAVPKNNRPIDPGATRFLIPCNDGKNAYVRNAITGTNPNLPTASAAFRAAVVANVEAGQGARMLTELTELAAKYPTQPWAGIISDLKTDGVFA